MDSELRSLERQAACGDATAQNMLLAAKDRVHAPYKVYILKEATWQYNDQWYSCYEPDVAYAYRSRERAEQEIINRFQKFLLGHGSPIDSRDWVDLMGVHSLQGFLGTFNEEDAKIAISELRGYGFEIWQASDEPPGSDYAYLAHQNPHYVTHCIPPKEVSLETAKHLLKWLHHYMYEIVETTLE